MAGILDYLPEWIAAAGVPAGSVIGFFWKGDDALSQDFKQWLSQKILRMKLTVPDISSIEPLGKVFDLVYGPRYFGLITFLRVAAVSTIALAVSCFMIGKEPVSSLWVLGKAYPVGFTLAVTVNIFFDYISVTKSRFLIVALAKLHKKYAVIIFIFVDLILTTIIFIVYATVTRPVMPQTVEELQSVPPIVMQAFTTWISAFFFSTFLTLLLTTVYSVSLVLLIFFNFLGTRPYMRWLVPENILSIIRWMLPVETLPIRSIGIVAGAFLFLFLAVFHALL